MNAYEEKQEAKRERLERAADRARAEADSAFRRADLREEVSGIPFGQPILVGHHSERRHRAIIAKSERSMRKGIEAADRAKALARKAAGVGTAGISSDDPDALPKLREKLAGMERAQVRMKAVNAAIRKHAKAGREAQIAALIGLGFSEHRAGDLITGDCCGRVGFPNYALTNNSGNMRRVRQRIAKLEQAASQPEVADEEISGVTIRRNIDDNRLQLIFQGKPDPDVRAKLKRHGFRWSPTNGAWQRQLSNAAEYAAKQVIGEVVV